MEFSERIERLRQLVAASEGIIEGSKKLQKLAYICQFGGDSLGQSFGFHQYGVYSPALAEDIQSGYSLGLLDLRDGLGSVVTRLPDKGNVNVPSGRGFDLVKKMHNEEARVLEVLTTILYLKKNGFSDSALRQKLHALKGQHKQFFERARKLTIDNFGIEVPELA